MIEVEFHNAGIHHTFSIPNHCGYTMAALSEQALVLACERSEDVARCVSVCLSVICTFVTAVQRDKE